MQGDDPISQKIKVYEFQGSLSTYSEHWQLAEDIRQYQIVLDKRDYQEIDSITFKASLRASNNVSRAFAELYNLTDSVSINNSLLTSKIRNWLHSVNSGDISPNIPDYPILLTIRLRSEYAGNYAEVNGKQAVQIYYK
jgi:hypothetical protein